MLSTSSAIVTALIRADRDAVLLEAVTDGEAAPRRALAYPALTGPVAVGDRVVLNVTATELHLGTGGVDFVIGGRTSAEGPAVFGDPDGTEHVVKLRYTPLQHAVRAAETDPALAAAWQDAASVERMPAVVCELHSQLGPACAGVKAVLPTARIAYLMTESAALPLALSDQVRTLRAAGLVDVTLTAGQAFGGDLECVTVASALLAARLAANADVVVVAPGPGSVGTGTQFGFSGMEQGMLLDLAGRLGATAIGVLRLSLAEKRQRHHGVSHHSVTTLGLLAHAPAIVAFPAMPPGVDPADYARVRTAVAASPIGARHTMEVADGAPGVALLAARGVAPVSMGRRPEDDPLFFHAAAAAGAIAAAHANRDDGERAAGF